MPFKRLFQVISKYLTNFVRKFGLMSICRLMLGLFVAQNLILLKHKYGLISSKTYLVEQSALPSPTLSLCQPIVNIFNLCRPSAHPYCERSDRKACTIRLLRNISFFFNQIKNCPYLNMLRIQLHKVRSSIPFEHDNRTIVNMKSVYRYIKDANFCLHFRGYPLNHSIYAISMLEHSLFVQRNRLFHEQNQHALANADPELLDHDFSHLATFKTMTRQIPFNTWLVFMHGQDRFEHPKSNLFEIENNQLLAVLQVRRVRVIRLPAPYDDGCRNYADIDDDQHLQNQRLCVEHCMDNLARISLQQTFFEWQNVPVSRIKEQKMRNKRQNSSQDLIQKCVHQCPPSCVEDHFYVRTTSWHFSRQNFFLIQLEPQVDVIEYVPRLSRIDLMLQMLNQINFVFNLNLIHCIHALHKLLQTFRLTTSSWSKLLGKHAHLMMITFVLYQLVCSMSEYLQYPVISATELYENQRRNQLQISVCFQIKQLYYHPEILNYNFNILKRHFKPMLKYDALYNSTWENLNLNVYFQDFHMFWLANDRLWNQEMKSISFQKIQRHTSSHKQFNGITSHIFGHACIKFKLTNQVLTLNYKCYVLRFHSNNCSQWIGIVHFYLEIFYSHLFYETDLHLPVGGKLLSSANLVENRRLLLPKPYKTDCWNYRQRSNRFNITCDSRQECVNLCMIDLTIRWFQKLPSSIPLLWPKYVSLVNEINQQLPFDTGFLHEHFRAQCNFQYSRPDCVQQEFTTISTQRMNQQKSHFVAHFNSKLIVTRFVPAFDFIRLVMHVIELISLCLGISLQNLLLSLHCALKRCFDLRPTSSLPPYLQMLLWLAMSYQLYELACLYVDPPTVSLTRAGNAFGRYNFPPSIAFCMDIVNALKNSTLKKRSTFHNLFVDESNRSYTGEYLNKITMNLSKSFISIEFLKGFLDYSSNNHQLQPVWTRLKSTRHLDQLDKSHHYENLEIKTFFFERYKCFLLRLRLQQFQMPIPPARPVLRVLAQPIFSFILIFGQSVYLNPDIHIKVERPIKLYYSNDLLRIDKSSHDCQQHIVERNLFDMADYMQRQLLKAFKRTSTQVPLSESFFKHKVQKNFKYELLKQYINLFSINNQSLSFFANLNDPKCKLSYRLHTSSYKSDHEKHYEFTLNAVLWNREILIENKFQKLELLTYGALVVNFWTNTSAVQLLQSPVRFLCQIIQRLFFMMNKQF